MSLFDGRVLSRAQRKKRPSSALTPEEEQAILADVAAMSGGTLSNLAWGLDTLGAGVRSSLVGKGFVEGALADAEDRVEGRDVLRHYGLASDEDTWGNYLAGLAVEVATDPLTYATGPASTLTNAGKAAKAAGILDDTARAASRKYLAAKAGTGRPIQKSLFDRAEKAYDAFTKDGRLLTESDLFSKPLVGKRAAQKYATLEDVVAHADDPAKAMSDVVTALGKGDAAQGRKLYNQIKSQSLSKDFGFAGMQFNLGSAGDKYADALDSLGSSVRWSLPGRAVAAAFDKRVDGKLGAEAQALGIAAAAKAKARKEAATGKAAEELAALSQSKNADFIFSEDGNKMLGRLIEGNATDADRAFEAANPAVRRYLNFWENEGKDILAQSESIGIGSAALQGPLKYLPYQADGMFEIAAKNNSGLRSELSTMTGDQLQRGDTLRLPGGRDQIMRLSKDYNVSGPKRSKNTDALASDYLAQQVYGSAFSQLPKEQQKQMESLARLLHRLPEEATKIAPLFGQHPTKQIQQYMEGRAVAMGNMDALLDGVVSYAVDIPSRQVAGGPMSGRGSVTINEAIERIGGKSTNNGLSGARQQIRERIAKATGRNANSIDLSTWSVPLEHLEKLVNADRLFTDAPTTSRFVKAMDSFTSIWKASILSWPSRITRDLYSGQFGNWLVGAANPEAIRASSMLLKGGAESAGFVPFLNSLPQYKQYATVEEKSQKFYADLAAHGLLGGGMQLDRVATVSGKSVLDQLPGRESLTWSGAASELFDAKGYGKDFFSIPTAANPYVELKNPILRAGDKANQLSDGINRISGYLSLLKKGYSPKSATETIKRVQVDYQDLSAFEKNVLRRMMPWYTYQSKIFREVVGQLATRPGGKYGQSVRAIDRGQQELSEGEYVPSHLRQQVALPTGLQAGSGEIMISDIDLPGFDQINMLPNTATTDPFLSMMEQVGSQLAPHLRVGAEFVSGRDFYHKTPIEQSRGIASDAYSALTGGSVLPYGYVADRVIGNVPFVQRPATAIRKLIDNRSDAPASLRVATGLADMFLGVKAPIVDDDRRYSDMTNLIDESLKGVPQVRTMSRRYVPEELEPDTPQWVIDRLRLRNQKRRTGPTRQ